MFVRKKTVPGGHKRYQLVKAYREGGKVRQRYLWHLGPHATVEEHLRALEEFMAGERRSRGKSVAYYIAREKLARFRAVLKGKEPPPRKGYRHWYGLWWADVVALLDRKPA
jgi:hypothetical protein